MRPAPTPRRVTRSVAGVLVCSLALVALLAVHRSPAAKHHARHAAALTATIADPSFGTSRLDLVAPSGAPRPAATLVAWAGTADSAATLLARTASFQPVRGPPAEAAV